MSEWKKRDLLTLGSLSKEEINHILRTAESFKEISTRSIKKVPALRGKTIASLFFEASTRTRTSFELAAKRLSADVVSIHSSNSSVLKGETLIDTARNIEAMSVDGIIIRHSSAGAPRVLSGKVSVPVINAGDGAHEHPTQGLLDIFTIRQKKKKIEGLKVSIVGDILHSRVARSNIWGLSKLGAEVCVCGPATLLPPFIERFPVKVTTSLKEALAGADVVMALRIQLERQKERFFPTLREYSREYGIDKEKIKLAKKDVLIMHPGPVNRGIELSQDVIDGPRSVILEQVTNGVAVRMAVLYLLLQKEETNGSIS
ncbi:MAG: aspartate carbamoyltransferase catalytic subunit [Candidatus Omnitrophica bacterium]|nr:aspartate carbamoyltransferase catalytic subunit [Candidatus Omnitrophota bacterium]